MALKINDTEIESMVDEIASITGESQTDVIRQVLIERRSRLRLRVSDPARSARIRRFLEREVWSRIPDEQLGSAPTKREREAILGFDPAGVG